MKREQLQIGTRVLAFHFPYRGRKGFRPASSAGLFLGLAVAWVGAAAGLASYILCLLLDDGIFGGSGLHPKKRASIVGLKVVLPTFVPSLLVPVALVLMQFLKKRAFCRLRQTRMLPPSLWRKPFVQLFAKIVSAKQGVNPKFKNRSKGP